MGRKKYYCDFCCRYFNDDKNIRSKHMNSLAHQNAKEDHYYLFRDPEEILRENAAKKTCTRFQKDGYCQFGRSCIYSHYTSYELDFLRQEIARYNIMKSRVDVPTSEAFYMKYMELKQKSAPSRTSMWSHDVPDSLRPLADNLPRSMQPFKIDLYEAIDLDTWG